MRSEVALSPYKTLLIGLGRIGMEYDLNLDGNSYVYSHARALSLHPEFELIGAVDPDQGCRKIFEQTYSKPAYENLEMALREGNPDIVVIASPTWGHAEVLGDVLQHSTPHAILCEKPLSNDLAEAEAMLSMCHHRNIKLFVNYIRRSDPGAIEIKRRIDSGLIELPMKGVAWYSKGLQHNGSHILNLLEYWLGPVQSFEIINPGRLWDQVDPEPDVLLKFLCGQIVLMAAWEERYSHYALELVAPNGRLRYELGGHHIEWLGVVNDEKVAGYQRLDSNPQGITSDMNFYQSNVLGELSKALAGKPSNICSGKEALTSLSNIDKIITSIS